MGEMAEYMLAGDDCSGCGEYLGDGDGFPRLCAACQAIERPTTRPSPHRAAAAAKPFKCRCNRRFREHAHLAQHQQDKGCMP